MKHLSFLMLAFVALASSCSKSETAGTCYVCTVQLYAPYDVCGSDTNGRIIQDSLYPTIYHDNQQPTAACSKKP